MENLVHEIPCTKPEGTNIRLGPGDGIDIRFTKNDILFDERSSYRLRITGETSVDPVLRCESGFPLLYRLIDDSLSTDEAASGGYSLELGSGCGYAKKAYYKAVLPHDADSIKKYKFRISCRKENVVLLPGGSICFTAELFYKKPGKHPADVSGPSDMTYRIDIGGGSCGWEEKSVCFNVDGSTGCILFTITAEKYTGTIRLADPGFINENGANLLPSFTPAFEADKYPAWLGMNLSKKEWPAFEIKLNEDIIFSGELFQRIYRWPVSELDIPQNLIKYDENTLSIKYISHYPDTVPFTLKKVGFVKKDTGFHIISCPDIAVAGTIFPVLVNVADATWEVSVKSGSSFIRPLYDSVRFEGPGLGVIDFEVLHAGQGCTDLSFEICGEVYTCSVERVVSHVGDIVKTGTGDQIYINQNIRDMEYFLSWYMHNRLGNSITFRPVYRWSGTRTLQADVWKRMRCLCEILRLHYSHMIDGRELPGCDANPDKELLSGRYFLGRQGHEDDGSYYYWGTETIGPAEELFCDIWSRSADKAGIFPERTPVRTDKGTFRYFSPYAARDMKEASEYFTQNISHINGIATRHTGPSVLFRYFYQAGIEWLGAELMYGPHELILAALRGASRAYRRNSYGAHLAVQWSTTPHDTEQRYRRYFLALYLSYMHGADQINTEEGLWRLEEMYSCFERFDAPCIEHKKIQKQFLRFVLTHPRRGSMHIPLAFVHGRYDGWNCFSRGQVWMQEGADWKFGPPEESWDLLTTLYPGSVLDSIYRHPCPCAPQGFYTQTPYGSFDIIPIEADTDILCSYRTLIFLGWNSAEKSQVEKLFVFVEKGGTLLLGWPHLFTCLKRPEAMGMSPEILDNGCIRELIGAELRGFCEITADGKKASAGILSLCGAEPVSSDPEGVPLVIENKIGLGKVIFVNIKAYPSEEAVRKIYTGLIKKLAAGSARQDNKRGRLCKAYGFGSAVYDTDQPCRMRTIYFINIKWWDRRERTSYVSLHWQGIRKDLEASLEHLNIVTLSDHWGIMTKDGATDVMLVSGDAKNGMIMLQCAKGAQVEVFCRHQDTGYHLSAADAYDRRCDVIDTGSGTWIIRSFEAGTYNIKSTYTAFKGDQS